MAEEEEKKSGGAAKAAALSKLFDDEAEESEDEENKDEDEDDDEEKENEYEKDDFVVSSEDEEEEDVEAPKKKKFSRLRKKRREDVPDEDDLDLVREAREEPTAKRSRTGNDEEGSAPPVPERTIKETDDHYFDDDNFDDFIEDDLGEQEALRERERMTKESGAASGEGGMSALAMQDMLEIFGRDYDEESEEEAPPARHYFEPSLISEHFVLPHDQRIMETDLPERLQLRSPACVGRTQDDFLKHLTTEVEFVKERLEIVEADDAAVRVVLSMINQHFLEVPFIRCYRRDYIEDCPALVDETKLWRLYELDDEFAQIQKRLDDARALVPVDQGERNRVVADVVSRAKIDEHSSKDAYRFAKRFAGGALSDGFFDRSSALKLRRTTRRNNNNNGVAGGGEDHDDEGTPKIPKKKKSDDENGEDVEEMTAAELAKYVDTWCLSPVDLDMTSAIQKPPPTPAETPEYHSINFAPSDSDAFRVAARVTAAQKISYCPSLRAAVRDDFRSAACVTTRPTEKGRQEIDVAHDVHGLQHLRAKFAVDFLEPAGDEEKAADYVRLLKARADGLIEIALAGAEVTDDRTIFANRLTDRFNLDALVSPALDKFIAKTFVAGDSAPSGESEKKEVAEEDVGGLLAAWNEEREMVLRLCFEQYLLPDLEEELKRDLARRGHEAVARCAGAEFRRRIDVAPFGTYEESGRTPRIAAATVGTGGEATHVVSLSENGVVAASMTLPGFASKRDSDHVDALGKFLLKHRPERIVFGASAGASACRKFRFLLEDSIAGAKLLGENIFKHLAGGSAEFGDPEVQNILGIHTDEEDFAQWSPRHAVAEDSLARSFSLSVRADNEFRSKARPFRAAVSLAREAQNAVAEFAYCWLSTGSASFATSGSTGLVLGYDCLAVKLHPLCDEVQPQSKLLKEYEKHLVEVVGKTGVDFALATTHDHYFGLLQFVPGLGPRKATALKQAAASYRSTSANSSQVPTRRALATLFPVSLPEDEGEKEDEDEDAKTRKQTLAQLTSKCFRNAAGFIRFSSTTFSATMMDDDDEDRNPLDATRIHPECYLNSPEASMQDWAQKMCSDALDRELRRHDRYSEIVQEAVNNSRTSVSNAIRRSASQLQQRSGSYTAFGAASNTSPDSNAVWMPPRFSSYFTHTSAQGVVSLWDRSEGHHPDAVADDLIGDKLSDLDLDTYARILEDDYSHGKRREQLEDIKRELRWPYAELRARVWDVPDESTIFEWFAGVSFPSKPNERGRAIRGMTNPAGGFAPRLRPRQILTVKVQGADTHRLFVELSGEVAGGLRGAIDKTKLVESDDALATVFGGLDVSDLTSLRATIGNAEAARIHDGDVFEACVVDLDVTRSRVNLSRLDVDVFFPESVVAYMSHPSTKDEPSYVDAAFDRSRAAADYVVVAAARKQLALEARAVRIERGQASKTGKFNFGAPVERRRRNIQHPAFKRDATSFVKAETALAQEDEGWAIVRPSASSHKLVLSWAFRNGIYKHVEIDEEEDEEEDDGKRRYDTRGVLIPRKKSAKSGGYRIGDGFYEDIDEILANHVEPMNAYVSDFVEHRKFAPHISSLEAVQAYLETEKQKAPSAAQYCFWIDPTHPGYVVLSWLHPKSSNAKHEFIQVAPNGLQMRSRQFKTVEQCVDYFKRHAKEWLTGAAPRNHQRSRTTASSRTSSAAAKQQKKLRDNQKKMDRPPVAPVPPRQNVVPPAAPITAYAATNNGASQPPYRPPPPQQQQQWPPNQAPPEGPGGRGRGRTLPAWMQQQAQL